MVQCVRHQEQEKDSHTTSGGEGGVWALPLILRTAIYEALLAVMSAYAVHQ